MPNYREKLQIRSKQFANILGRRSEGTIKNIWQFGSLPDGKKRPRDADLAVEIVPNAISLQQFIELRDELASARRFGGVKIHAVPVTSSELKSGNTEVAQSVQQHKIKLWPS